MQKEIGLAIDSQMGQKHDAGRSAKQIGASSRVPKKSIMPKKSKTVTTISDELIRSIRERLLQGNQVRRTLPLNGRLHIDRTLPFLVVYRRPSNRPDIGTERLVKGEASYLIASDSARLKDSLSELIRNVVVALARECGAFLIIEIWTASKPESNSAPDPIVQQPSFNIAISMDHAPMKTVEALETALERIRILRKPAIAQVVDNRRPIPAGLTPLIPTNQARKLNCYFIGLEIEPVYRKESNGDLFPVVLRTLHRGLSRAFKRAAFEFSLSQTSHRPANYQALGRRAVVKAVWEIDSKLSEVSNAFDFLLQVTPVNTDAAWSRFQRQHFDRLPTIYYRPLPVDPADIKRMLYEIRIDQVEDPTLAFIFAQKRREMDRQLSMLADRGSPDFLYGSLQLYGGVSDELGQLAETLLNKLPRRSREDSRGGYLKPAAVAEQARAEIEYYRQLYPALSARVHIRDDTVGLMVSRGNLLIGKRAKIPASRINALLQHEIGTHILTYFNGRAQPFKQLYSGLAGYEALQEGLAVLAEYLAGGLSRPRLRLLAGRVVAVLFLTRGATFVDTFRELNRSYGFKQRTAFAITIRVYRGGGLTKDAVYLRGLVELLSYLQKSGQLEPLFVGKFAVEHIPVIRELQYRKVLQPAPLRPRYLQDPKAVVRLERLRNGMSVQDLIERKR